MMPLLHISLKILDGQKIVFQAYKAMGLPNALFHKFSMTQLNNASKLRRGKPSAHSEARGAQATALLARCCQQRINRKVGHSTLDFQLSVLADATTSQKGTLLPGKGAEMVNYKALAI